EPPRASRSGNVAPRVAPPMVPGIDVSHHQGIVDWQAIAASGIRFAYAKATEGQTFVDPAFSENWPRVKDAGLVRGVYQLFRPAAPAENQGEPLLRTVPGWEPGAPPPVLDLEEARAANGADEWDGVPAEQRVIRALEWLRSVEDAFKIKPFIYTRAG